MMYYKKFLILDWAIVLLLLTGIIYWYCPKTNQGQITNKIKNDGIHDVFQIVLDDSKYYRFANFSEWASVRNKSIIKITYREISIYPIVIPLIESYEIIKKPP